MTESLVKYFKRFPVLDTDIGAFEYASDLGQGGNAHVLKFKRDKHEFAIKFIPCGEEGKLSRFRDEFFCAAQIPTHENVVTSYHFDTREINSTVYSLIVMKAYESTLSKIGHVAEKSVTDQREQAWKLFSDLSKGLHHLHANHIIHRDIKPQNIFYDEKAKVFVIGDLGIAHFKAEVFAKEARTKPADRLANYLFSAPEQASSKSIITEAADIYSLGQVIQWYLTGNTVRGQGRASFATISQQDELSILDAFTRKALRDNPAERFLNFDSVADFVKKEKSPPLRDPWAKIDAFDAAIRRSFPMIRKTLAVAKHDEIDKFLTNFQQECDPTEFWYMMADGGDGHFESLERLEKKVWLLNGITEMAVSKLLIYRNDGYPYKNFFILLFGPNKRFVYCNSDGKPVKRKPSTWDQDVATLLDDKFYIDPSETDNGFYRINGDTLPVSRERFKDRVRFLTPYGLMVIPNQTASASMTDREPTSEMIRSAIQNKDINEQQLQCYLDATRAHHSIEITKWS